MKFLTDFILNNFDIPEDSLKKLVALISYRELNKGDALANIGEIPNEIYILKKGIIRSCFIDEKGKEYIRHIFTPIRATGALGAMILNKPSRLSYDCLSDCEVYALNFKKFKELSKRDHAIANLYAAVLEYVFLTLESKVFDLSVLNATERYIKLKKEIPDIDNLIPQYHIASYLNITPVQLSRIRKKMYSK